VCHAGRRSAFRLLAAVPAPGAAVRPGGAAPRCFRRCRRFQLPQQRQRRRSSSSRWFGARRGSGAASRAAVGAAALQPARHRPSGEHFDLPLAGGRTAPKSPCPRLLAPALHRQALPYIAHLPGATIFRAQGCITIAGSSVTEFQLSLRDALVIGPRTCTPTPAPHPAAGAETAAPMQSFPQDIASFRKLTCVFCHHRSCWSSARSWTRAHVNKRNSGFIPQDFHSSRRFLQYQ